MTKRMMKAAVLSTSLVLAMTAGARGNEVTFAQTPAVRTSGGRSTLAFAVDHKTDVAVYVLNAKGKVVRHLAAGVLGGENPPPEPLKPGLSQSLVWDGKDNAGNPATGGPFRLRVALGLKPEFDRMIGFVPADLGEGRVRSLATGPDGTLYVYNTCVGFGTGASHGTIKAFDRDGKYLRTVSPYPANLPEEKLKGIKRIEIAPGVRVPFVYNAETRALLPGLGGEPGVHRAVVTPQGRLFLSGSMGIARDNDRVCRLVSINTDGSIPDEGLLGPAFGKTSPPRLAASPDGKTLYAVGVTVGGRKRKPTNAVYAFAWSDKKPKPLVTEGLKAPCGVAVDKDGNIYVADKGNNRIAVFKPDGTPLGEIKTGAPELVDVHSKTGAIYVLAGNKAPELRKYNSWKEGKLVARVRLPYKTAGSAAMALDGSGQTAVVWFGSSLKWGSGRLVRIEDRGSDFGKAQDVTKLPGHRGAAFKPTDMFVMNGKLFAYSQRGYNGPWVFEARTGKRVSQKTPKRPPSIGNLLQGDHDGNYYVLAGKGGVRRFDSRLKPFPFPAGAKGAIPKTGNARTRARGMDVDVFGNVYVLRQKLPEEKQGDANAVAKFGPDGKEINKNLVDSDIRGLNSVRVDPKGNIYLALGARAGGKLLPPNIDGQLPNAPKDPDAESGHNYYPLMYGSIVKFGPEGGKIRQTGDGLQAGYAYNKKVFIKGAQWSFFGASLVPTFTHGGMRPNICACESPRFDVDGFGRSFFGDACGFRVGVLDSAGNLIRWFGDYGNQDSAGPESAMPTPEIPIGWVHAVAVDEEAAFIGDRLNQRVMRVKLGYTTEATCDVR